jgi:hypothetical protein
MIKNVRDQRGLIFKGEFRDMVKDVVTGIKEGKGEIVNPVTFLTLSRCNMS